MIGAKKRFAVLKRDDFRCQYCWRNGKDVTLEVDHVIPKSKWGNDDISNLVTCCRECNIGKWSDLIEEYEWIVRIKIWEHEKRTIKDFFSMRNEEWYGEINKNNVAFISAFLKGYYTYKTIIWFVESELVGYTWRLVWEWKITLDDFTDWGENCDLCLWERDTFVWDNDLYRILGDTWENEIEDMNWNSRKRNTNDYNKRINWLISRECVWQDQPKSLIYKYTLFPKLIAEWEKEKTKR